MTFELFVPLWAVYLVPALFVTLSIYAVFKVVWIMRLDYLSRQALARRLNTIKRGIG